MTTGKRRKNLVLKNYNSAFHLYVSNLEESRKSGISVLVLFDKIYDINKSPLQLIGETLKINPRNFKVTINQCKREIIMFIRLSLPTSTDPGIQWVDINLLDPWLQLIGILSSVY